MFQNYPNAQKKHKETKPLFCYYCCYYYTFTVICVKQPTFSMMEGELGILYMNVFIFNIIYLLI